MSRMRRRRKSRAAGYLELVLTVAAIGGCVSIAVFVDHLGVAGVFGVLLLLVGGPGLVFYGVTLSAGAQATKPVWSEEGLLGLWIARHLPMRLARAWWVGLGLTLSTVLVSALLTRAGSTASRAAGAVPHDGHFSGRGAPPYKSFAVSFTVSGSEIRDAVVTWRALCQDGATYTDRTSWAGAPARAWAERADYVTQTRSGLVAHVHVIQNTGHFTNPTLASGLWSASVILELANRQLARCKSGSVRWNAHSDAGGGT